ncbi:metallophosphoesterase [Nanoarchaeota archaeon]
MNRILAFIIFFGIFFTIYFGMHFYTFMRLSAFLKMHRNLWFYLAMVALTLSFPLMSFMERFIGGQIARVFYALAATWLGAVFLLLVSLAVYEIVRLITKTNDKTAGLVIMLVVLVIVFYGIINAFFIRVNTIEIPIDNLEKETTLVQISDVHLGTIHNSGYMTRIVDKINDINPDMVLITGDFVDGSGKIVEHSVAPLNKLRPKTFFSTGNHEMYEGIDEVIGLLEMTKVEVLRNEVVEYKGIQVIGIDNPAREMRRTNDEISKIKFDKKRPSVLMFHPPQGLEDASRAGVDLQLSGHTHNGQIFPFNLITRIFYPKISGIYMHNDMYLHVSPGTGTWGPPMRFGSRSEITVLNLVKRK